MPKCKNCNAELSRLDKDICPFCGTLKPFDGQENYETEDVTKAFDPIKDDLEDIKYKSKVVCAILAMTLGVFGAHFFYLGKKKLGLIMIAITAVFVASIGCALFFTGALHNVFAFLIPYFALEAAMIASGVITLLRSDIVDARGEFLK
ncbi:MAG: TM2 domain-containing protein [Bacilli bacterium]|nr:TM2 domain-containing protein [Bacilli bacterium]